MAYDEMMQNWDEAAGISFSDFIHIVKAVSQVYPMIVLANLSKVSQEMLCMSA